MTEHRETITDAERIIRGSHQWASNGDQWFSATGMAQALDALAAARATMAAWGERVLRELDRDAGYAGYVDELRAELHEILGEEPAAPPSGDTKGGSS